MQRQSLGGCSPSSKYNLCGSKDILLKPNEEEEVKRKGVVIITDDDEEQKKIEKKPNHHHHNHQSIHLIPILTICCILILYLCSYDPPQKDLANIDGFKRISNQIDSSSEIGDFRRFSEVERGDVLAIRSHRSLHEIRKDNRKPRFNRKIGDF